MSNLTPDKEAHLQRMQDKFLVQSRQKYEAGQIEHGGRMWEKPGMLEHAKEEVIDLWHYLCTLEEQIAQLKTQIPPVDKPPLQESATE